MAIIELFSKRQKKLRGEFPDVYSYDNIPEPLRVQIVWIWKDLYSEIKRNGPRYFATDYFGEVIVILCREYGVFNLSASESLDSFEVLIDFFLKEKNQDKILDVIELSFRVLELSSLGELFAASVKELNQRFKEHGVGYQFDGNQIIRMDSEFIHSEVVKPALQLLNRKNFSGAQEEFLKAHEHYRHGNYKESVNECLKSFESLMKSICCERGWDINDKGKNITKDACAKRLIETCFEKGLIPDFWQQSFTSLRSLLESSVPAGRNKVSGHGQGMEKTEIPDYLASYILHMTASCLVFLGRANEELK